MAKILIIEDTENNRVLLTRRLKPGATTSSLPRTRRKACCWSKSNGPISSSWTWVCPG